MVTTSRRRRRYTRQQRWAHLERFERSGLSPTEFCRRRGIHLATFSLWRRKAKATLAPGFAEVQLSAPLASGTATLHLPGGVKLEVAIGADAAWLGLGLLLKTLHA